MTNLFWRRSIFSKRNVSGHYLPKRQASGCLPRHLYIIVDAPVIACATVSRTVEDEARSLSGIGHHANERTGMVTLEAMGLLT